MGARKSVRVACLAACVTALCVATRTSADSITVDDKVYENVIVKSSPTMYYVQIPEDGSVVNAVKAKSNITNVVISKNRKERLALLKQWRQNRRKTDSDSEATSAAPISIPSRSETAIIEQPPKPRPDRDESAPSRSGDIEAIKARSGMVLFTGRPEKYRNGNASAPVFLAREGYPMFTNKAEEYRGKVEFIEVRIPFDRIIVPDQYLGFDSPARYTTANICELVRHYAKMYSLDENLVFAVMRAESNFNPNAVSPAGARGLMQLMPGTALEMGISDIFDPAQNIAGGAQYLAKMLAVFGDQSLAIAAYNAGPANVKKHKGIPPFEETRQYVPRVLRFYREFKRSGVSPNTYLAKAHRVNMDFLPSSGTGLFTIQFKNGLTQRAEEVYEDGDYYCAVFKNVPTTIRKDQVERVLKPA